MFSFRTAIVALCIMFPYHLNPADLIQYQFVVFFYFYHLLISSSRPSPFCSLSITSVVVHWGTSASAPDCVQSCLWKCTNSLHHGERASQRPRATTSRPGWARMRAEHDPWNGILWPAQWCLCLRDCDRSKKKSRRWVSIPFYKTKDPPKVRYLLFIQLWCRLRATV